MEVSPQTVIALKDAANENIRKYCKIYNEDFNEVKMYIHKKCDEFNLLPPYEFYMAVYNMSLEFSSAS